jgi:uncharacterized repeat protein (TIGR03833 family)
MWNSFPPLILEEKKYELNHIRSEIKPGQSVLIVEKHNQRSGILTKGTVKTILSPNKYHTRGIKVRLITGQVGRVQCIIGKQKCKKLE